MTQNLDTIRSFILAGNALFTVKSKLTGEHRTYLVEKPEPTAQHPIPTWFVKLGVGNDQFIYLGFMRCDGMTGAISFITGKGHKPEAPAIQGFKWLLTILNNAVEPSVARNFERCAEFMHAGRCGRCGRPLTNPESIETGIGPICAARA